MIRKILLVGFSLVFAGSVLAFSVHQSATSSFRRELSEIVMAKEAESLEFVVTANEAATPEAVQEVDYQLTWPGLLPGHVLYPVKMLRDRVWLFLATDPLKKAELYLRLADKRLWAAELLAEKEKVELAVSTATKAEKYLEQAINQEGVARQAGKDTAPFLERINLASQKHEQVLARIRARVGEAGAPIINDLVGYPQRVREQVRERRSQD